MNQKQYFENIVFQGDIYFPQTVSVCSPGVEFKKVGYTLNGGSLVPTQ